MATQYWLPKPSIDKKKKSPVFLPRKSHGYSPCVTESRTQLRGYTVTATIVHFSKSLLLLAQLIFMTIL